MEVWCSFHFSGEPCVCVCILYFLFWGGGVGGRGGEPFEETRFAGNLSRFLLSEIFAVRHEVPEVKIQEEEKKKKNDEAVFHGFSRGSGRTHRRLQG